MNEKIQTLTELFSRLPGVGPKSAQRIIFALLEDKPEYSNRLADELRTLHTSIHPCTVCGSWDLQDPCSICSDNNRDQHTICVVETVRDIMVLENNDAFNGIYHVLGGTISPQKGIHPHMLSIGSLLTRIAQDTVQEVVLATNTTIDGESTARYIQQLITDQEKERVSVSRIAQGMPMGGDFTYIDRHTLLHALQKRTQYS